MAILTKLCIFAGGVLTGTAGVAILSSDDAKKVYTHCAAAILRGKDKVVEKATAFKENCDDIIAEANDLNERRSAEKREREIADAKALLESLTEEKKTADEKAAEEADEKKETADGQ